jgi:polysaccharide biosynthesis protein PslH
LRLLHLSPYVADPPRHGGRIRTRELLRAEVEAGFDVVNVALAADEAEMSAAEALRREGVDARVARRTPFTSRLSTGERAKKWTRVLTGRSSLLPRWRSPELERLAAAAADERPFDLVVVETPWVDAARPLRGRVPYVASTQNVESDLLFAQASGMEGPAAFAAKADAAALARFEARWARDAAATIAVSENDARRFAELAHGARTVVVRNGFDAARVAPLPPPPQDGGLLFVGSFDYPPNVEAARRFLRDMAPTIRASLGPIPCVVAGRAPPDDLRDFATRAGAIVVADPPEMTPLYEAARAVVVPLRVGGGSRLKILEAFALGRPVVSTAAGKSGLDVAHERELLVAEDGAGFAAALRRLFDDAAFAGGLVERARAFVERDHAWADARRIYVAALDVARRTAAAAL